MCKILRASRAVTICNVVLVWMCDPCVCRRQRLQATSGRNHITLRMESRWPFWSPFRDPDKNCMLTPLKSLASLLFPLNPGGCSASAFFLRAAPILRRTMLDGKRMHGLTYKAMRSWGPAWPYFIAAQRLQRARISMSTTISATHQTVPHSVYAKRLRRRRKLRTRRAVSTLVRVAFPTFVATIIGAVYFDNISLYVRSLLDTSSVAILEFDESQFVQNFLTVIGLLFSILAGNAYSALYAQQESIYFALFQEVSEAKSLLEQTTLVCQGRPFYQSALTCIRDYVKNDLRNLEVPPAQLLSTRPMEDPLESIMYMTSVGVPSSVYETVKSLRQARGVRLGATQRKFPFLGIGLLYLLAALELLAFPLLGAGVAEIRGILSLQAFLFGFLSGAHMLVLRIIQELWQSSGGVFNVDEVLQQMVFGLEEELELRSRQAPEIKQAGSQESDTKMLPPYLQQDMYAWTPTWVSGQYAPPNPAGNAKGIRPAMSVQPASAVMSFESISVASSNETAIGSNDQDVRGRTSRPPRRGFFRNVGRFIMQAVRSNEDDT